MSYLPDFENSFDVMYIDYSKIDLTTIEEEKPLLRRYDYDVFSYSDTKYNYTDDD